MKSKNIQVAIRIRPKHQREQFLPDFGSFDSNNIEIVHRGKIVKSSYSRIFGPLTDQQEIYEFIAPSLNQVDQGYSSAIFAYGQTGSGKTFTMFGTDTNSGLVHQSIFHIISNLGESFKISLSLIQIYKEEIFDMLQEPYKFDHSVLREDPLFGVYVKGIIEYVVQTPEDIIELLRRGNSNRCIRNTVSSYLTNNSHCICQINIESKIPNADGNIIRAKARFIDLAGSELRDMTNAPHFGHSYHIKEINKSLKYLGNVINCINSKPGKYIPHRDSRLTFLLKDSLHCNTGIVFIATLCPTVDTIEETINTLRFARNAGQVTLNEKPTQFSVSDNKLAEKLQREVLYLKDTLKIPKNKDSMQLKLLSLEEENAKLKLNLELRMDKVLKENRLMKEKLINLAETQELDEIEQLCKKFYSIKVTSTTRSSYRRTTPYSRTIDSRLVMIRIRKNLNGFKKRSTSLQKTLEQFENEKNEDREQVNKVQRLKPLQLIRAYRENKANEASEKFQKTLALHESLMKKDESCKTLQISEDIIKTFRDIDFSKKAIAKAEGEKEKAMISLKKVQNIKVSRSPLSNSASQQIFSKNVD